MPNTVIALKKSATPGAKPLDLANGEIALNFADGLIFYKNTANVVVAISGGSTGSFFGTVNAAGTLLVADTSNDILTIEAGTNITITPDAANDRMVISASAGSDPNTPLAFNKANAANVLAFNALPNVSGVSTAGTLVIPTGNLNIGGTSVSAKLYVIASGGNSAAVVYGSLGGITVDYKSSSENYYEANLHQFKSGTTGPNSERMRIDASGVTANGNVIIRSHGAAQLSIEADADNVNEFENARLYLKQDGGGTVMRMGFVDGGNDFEFMHESTGNGLRFGANNITHMAMDVNGNISIGAGTSSTPYKLEVVGSFAATTKSFVIPHPTKENFKLRYGSLEGPENGIYLRGRSKKMTIELPEYWEKLVDPDTITVSITPIDRKQDLFVKSVTPKKVVLGGARKPDFFFTVFAERKDVPKLVVEYE